MLTQRQNRLLAEISVSISSGMMEAITRYLEVFNLPQNDPSRNFLITWQKHKDQTILGTETDFAVLTFHNEIVRISMVHGIPKRISYFDGMTGYYESAYIERSQTQKALRDLVFAMKPDEYTTLNQIQDLLDGTAWSPDTLDDIARVMIKAGYRIRDLEDRDRDDLAEDAE